MTTNITYEIQPISSYNKEDIIIYLRRVFFQDEPLNSYLKLITEENPKCPSLEEFSVRHLDDGVNLMALYNNNIIGICLCVVIEKGIDDTFDCENEKYNKIVQVLEYAEKHCNPFTIYPKCSKGVSVLVISVDKKFTGQGIATKLLQRACEISKQRGLEFMTITCTGLYSAKIAKKLKFDLKYTMDYKDYKVNGTIVFKPDLPHTSLSVYIKTL